MPSCDKGQTNKNLNAYIIYGEDYRAMAARVCRAAELAYVIPGKHACIALKPNLVLASPACQGATTHPEVCAGVIDYLKHEGFKNIAIAEGSWVGERTARAAEACGYNRLSKEAGVPFIDTQAEPAVKKDCAGMAISVSRCVDDFDFLINLPVVKGHCQTKITCALKNMKGLIPNGEKRRFHAMGLHKPIACLSAAVRQGFILADAICGDLDFEEGGSPVIRNMLMGFYDPVLCDAYAAELLGYGAADIPYIGMAEKLGAGSARACNINFIKLNAPCDTPFTAASRRVARLTGYINQRGACSACCASAVHALRRLESEGGLRLKNGSVAIGQGFRGMAGDIGIGSCTAGFSRHLDGCPPTASEAYRFLKGITAGT